MNLLSKVKTMLDTPSGDDDNYPQQRDYSQNRESHHPLFTEKIFSDRKVFFMDLKENNRGRFLKITEDVRGRRDTIMLPIESLNDFIEALHRIEEYEKGLE
ncbi:MAG: DNA-binding protein [Verrucomicrobiota bacterium]